MDSGHAEAAVLLIEAGADRTRVRMDIPPAVKWSWRPTSPTGKPRQRNSRGNRRRGRSRSESRPPVCHRPLWTTVIQSISVVCLKVNKYIEQVILYYLAPMHIPEQKKMHCSTFYLLNVRCHLYYVDLFPSVHRSLGKDQQSLWWQAWPATSRRIHPVLMHDTVR